MGAFGEAIPMRIEDAVATRPADLARAEAKLLNARMSPGQATTARRGDGGTAKGPSLIGGAGEQALISDAWLSGFILCFCKQT